MAMVKWDETKDLILGKGEADERGGFIRLKVTTSQEKKVALAETLRVLSTSLEWNHGFKTPPDELSGGLDLAGNLRDAGDQTVGSWAVFGQYFCLRDQNEADELKAEAKQWLQEMADSIASPVTT